MSGSATIFQPSDAGYDKARFAFDLADLRPAAACVAHTTEEVRDAILWARQNNLKVATFATGHRAVALPELEESLLLRPVLDQHPVIDPVNRVARVQAGTVWEPVVEAAASASLTAMHGSSPTVGTVGFVLGGGLSFYGREHGLTCNKVRAIEAITADGEFARIDHENEPDLFWALRGAGGWAAVVTAIEFELLPFPEIFGGSTYWPVESAEAALSIWLDWTNNAPESTTTSFRVMNLPPLEELPPPLRGQSVVAIDGVSTDAADGQALVAQLDGIGEPLLGGWGPMASAAALRLHGDPEEPVPAHGCSTLVDDLDDESVAAYVEAAGGESGSSLFAAEFRQLGGALRRADQDGGVVDMIDAGFIAFGVGLAADADSLAKTRQDLDQLMTAMQPWESENRFLNFSDPQVTLDQCFGRDSAEALIAIRREYDPDEIFVSPVAGV